MFHMNHITVYKTIVVHSWLLYLQDYGKESQAKDVIEEYFKSKKWGPIKKWNEALCCCCD